MAFRNGYISLEGCCSTIELHPLGNANVRNFLPFLPLKRKRPGERNLEQNAVKRRFAGQKSRRKSRAITPPGVPGFSRREMMSPKKAWAKFANMLLRAPEGAAYGVGISWDARKGWRPYQSIGAAILQMDTATARGLVASAYRRQSDPAFNDLKPLFDDLAKICDEADQKNRDRIIPDGAAEHLPAQGTA